MNEVAPIMKKYEFTDLNLDIESVAIASEESRARFTEFVSSIKKELDILLEEEKLLVIKKSSLDTERANLERNIDIFKKEVNEKEEIKSKIEQYRKVLNFIDTEFINLMEVIEKKVIRNKNIDKNPALNTTE